MVWPSLLMLLGVIGAGIVTGGMKIGWSVPTLNGFNVSGGTTLVPEFVAMVASLSVDSAGFVAELVRGGIEAIPKGQGEAARSLGLHRYLEFRLVILPQTLKVIIPPMVNVYLDIIKDFRRNASSPILRSCSSSEERYATIPTGPWR